MNLQLIFEEQNRLLKKISLDKKRYLYNNLTFAPKPKHFLRNILQHSDDIH